MATNFEAYRVKNGSRYDIQVCSVQYISSDDTRWHINDPSPRHLPILAVQLAVMIFIMRLLIIVLKPLRQPRFAAELIASILVGPSVLGRFIYWKSEALKWMNIFPFDNTMLLESFANLAVTYYMFLVGLEMDLSTVKHTEKKSWSIAIAGILIPSFTGASLYFLPIVTNLEREGTRAGAVFWAITLSITSFPDLARTLSDVKLLHTELGRIALTSAIITDISTWVFLAVAISFFDDSHQDVIWSILPIVCFATVCCFVLRPAIAWMIERIKNQEGKFSDTHIYFFLIGVAVCGVITDACGSHSLVGGFIFGLIIPKGELAIEIMEKTEEFVTGFLLQSFIISSGLRTNIFYLVQKTRWLFVVLTAVVGTSAKILSTVLASSFFGMSIKDGLTLGGLMNSKGIFALIVLNEGRNIKTLDVEYMVVMVLTVLVMTCLVEPIVILVNRTGKSLRLNKLRSIQGSDPEAELRMFACIHSVQNLSGIIRLLEISNASRKHPICVFAVHLVELTERASAMLIVHDKLKSSITSSPSHKRALSDDIFSAFENYKTGNHAASVHPLTVLSPYTTMHENIFELAEDKAVKLILIPFHKQATADGELHDDKHPIEEVNKNLLAKAPCSVGILIDRGLGSSNPSKGRPMLRLAMLFIGGPDDHEALSYAWRMAGTPGITFIVVRFRLRKDEQADIVPENKNLDNGTSASFEKYETREAFDDDYINEFRFKSMCEESITYNEKLVNNSEELERAIRLQYNNFDLYIVGRGLGVKSPLTTGLMDWGDSPELGPIGDTLVSSTFTAHASVLVVQRSASGRLETNLQRSRSKFEQKKWASPILNPEYEAIVNDKKKG